MHIISAINIKCCNLPTMQGHGVQFEFSSWHVVHFVWKAPTDPREKNISILENCLDWLNLSPKISLKHHTPPHLTPPHYTTPTGTFIPLLDKLGRWNLAQTLTRPTILRNILNPTHHTKTSRFKSKVFQAKHFRLESCLGGYGALRNSQIPNSTKTHLNLNLT